MPVSLKDWSLYFLIVMLVPAVLSYLCGCINGAILISKHFLKEDVRSRGSGNAGLTNFYRNYGSKYVALVLALDALKMVAAVAISGMMMGWTLEAKLWGGVFCVLGHVFPATYQFKGGKGILSGGTLLILLDWRMAVVGFGLFFLFVILTRYVSLGSVAAAASAPLSCFVFYPGHWMALVLISIIGGLLIWSHRSNIVRLIHGTESKFRFN